MFLLLTRRLKRHGLAGLPGVSYVRLEIPVQSALAASLKNLFEARKKLLIDGTIAPMPSYLELRPAYSQTLNHFTNFYSLLATSAGQQRQSWAT